MDEDLRQGKANDAPSPEQVPLNPWDSPGPESDTESLAQEKSYQQELQKRIGCNKTTNCIQSEGEETSSFLHQVEEHEANEADEELEALQVYDSLESLDIVAQEFEKNTPLLSPVEASDGPLDTNERDLSRLSSDDAYADLRYDPNWRTNLKDAGHFTDNTVSEQRCDEYEVLSTKGGCQYVVVRGPALAEAPHSATTCDCEQPYHLHQQHSEASTAVSVTSPRHPHVHQNYTLDETPERPLGEVRNVEVHNHASKTQNGFPEQENMPVRYDELHDMDQSQQVATKKQSLSKCKNPELLCRKAETRREDVVKRNKITLGRDTDKCGSYLKAYTMKQETHNALDQVSDIPEEVILPTPPERLECSPEDSSDPELRWLQKTQQLKVIQFTKRKKDLQKGSHLPRSQNKPLGQASGARPGGHVSPSAAQQPNSNTRKATSLSQPVVLLSDAHAQLSRRWQLTGVPSQPAPLAQVSPVVDRQPALPTINLSISLSTSSELLPLLHQKVVTLASPSGLRCTPPVANNCGTRFARDRDTPVPVLSPHIGPAQGDTVPQRVLSSPSSDPGCRRQGLNGGDLLGWPQEMHHGRWQRLPVPQFSSSHMENNHDWSPSEVSVIPYPYEVVGPSGQSQCPGSYTVLPPIVKPLSGGGAELIPAGGCGQSQQTQRKNPIPRSCSDGYLAQMEKQRQLAERATYKPYTLKDYKHLNQDINLRGLGPDPAAIEKTAEKMRRQKLYSNVIREQNKKISRIPFLPAKELEDSDKNLPRRKALEYARSISKPPIPPQPKPKKQPPSKGSAQNAPYIGGLDLTQLTTLELLRKRHEEEKLAVARFRKVH